MRYYCSQCDHRANGKSSLIRHIKSVHEGVKYECNQCAYRTTKQVSVTCHIQSVHEGVKYDCNSVNIGALLRVILLII